jgi:hypothetical protein
MISSEVPPHGAVFGRLITLSGHEKKKKERKSQHRCPHFAILAFSFFQFRNIKTRLGCEMRGKIKRVNHEFIVSYDFYPGQHAATGTFRVRH